MTYPKSEIRNKDCGPLAWAGPAGFSTKPVRSNAAQLGTLFLKEQTQRLWTPSGRLPCVQDIFGFCNCSDLTATNPTRSSFRHRWSTCSLFVTPSPPIYSICTQIGTLLHISGALFHVFAMSAQEILTKVDDRISLIPGAHHICFCAWRLESNRRLFNVFAHICCT